MEPPTRTELEATLAARRELGPGHDDELVAGFLERIDHELDRRVDEKLARKRPGSDHPSSAQIVLGSLGLSIPLIAIAGGTAGVFGVIAVCIAIVLVNLGALRH